MLRNMPIGTNSAQSMPIIQISRNPKSICFTPMAYGMFDSMLIRDACIEAITKPGVRPEKYLMGWPREESASVLQTYTLTEELINEFSTMYDAMARANGAHLRADGVTFSRMTHANRVVERFISETARPAKKRNEDPVYVSQNMAYESALRQHVRACFPIDEEVRDPEFIRKQYIEAGGELGTSDYPNDLVRTIMQTRAVQKGSHLETACNVNTRDMLREAEKRVEKRCVQADAVDEFF